MTQTKKQNQCHSCEDRNLQFIKKILPNSMKMFENKLANSIELYLEEVNKFPILDEKSEKELLILVQKGDKNARKTLAESYLQLVVDIAKKYAIDELDLIDIIQEGNVSLFRAIDGFDLNNGYGFKNYATEIIETTLKNYYTDK